MALLDGMIRTGRLEEFVTAFVRTVNEEQEDETLWAIWLHRIHDRPYGEWKASLQNEARAEPTPEEMRQIASASRGIVAGFARAREGKAGEEAMT